MKDDLPVYMSFTQIAKLLMYYPNTIIHHYHRTMDDLSHSNPVPRPDAYLEGKRGKIPIWLSTREKDWTDWGERQRSDRLHRNSPGRPRNNKTK